MDSAVNSKRATYEKKIQELCKQNINCKDSMCNKFHPRCFIDIVIEGLQTKNKLCSDNNCKLKHLLLKNLRNKYNIDSINGILYFKGLCPNLKCLKSHISWEDYLKGLTSKEIIQTCIKLHKVNPIPTEPSKILEKDQELLQIRKELENSYRLNKRQ